MNTSIELISAKKKVKEGNVIYKLWFNATNKT